MRPPEQPAARCVIAVGCQFWHKPPGAPGRGRGPMKLVPAVWTRLESVLEECARFSPSCEKSQCKQPAAHTDRKKMRYGGRCRLRSVLEPASCVLQRFSREPPIAAARWNKRAQPKAAQRKRGVDEPYPRHWSQRLGLLRSRPDPVRRASMRGGPSARIVAHPLHPPGRGSGSASQSARRAAERKTQRSCRSSSPKRMPSGSISSCLSPSSTRPATSAGMPWACAMSTVRCASSARTNSAKPAPMLRVL